MKLCAWGREAAVSARPLAGVREMTVAHPPQRNENSYSIKPIESRLQTNIAKFHEPASTHNFSVCLAPESGQGRPLACEQRSLPRDFKLAAPQKLAQR